MLVQFSDVSNTLVDFDEIGLDVSIQVIGR